MHAGDNCVACQKLGTDGVWTAQDRAVAAATSVRLLEQNHVVT